MRYYKVIQYGNDADFSTKETIINEVDFQQYRKLISEGKEKLVLKDRIISVSSIKEIVLADDIVAEYQRQGVKIEGLLEPVDKPKEIAGGVRKFGDIFKEKKDEFYERMGWK